MPLRAVRSTRKASSLSSSPTWSRTTAGTERASWREQWVDGECVGEWLTLVCHYPLKPSSTLHLLLTHTPLTGPESWERAAPGGFVCLEESARMCVCVRPGTWEHTEIHECIHKVYRHTCVKTTAYRMSRLSQPDGLYYKRLYSYAYMT